MRGVDWFARENMLCFNRKLGADAFFEGTQDSEFFGKNHSHFRIRVYPCDESRLTEEQKSRNVKCKSPDEITKWRAGKKLYSEALQPAASFD